MGGSGSSAALSPATNRGGGRPSCEHLRGNMRFVRSSAPTHVEPSPCGEGWEGSYLFVSFSFSRTSLGPMIFAPMPWITDTAFSTSWPLVASWPLPT